LGNYDRSIADFTAGIKTDRHIASAYNFRGNAYHKKGDFGNADADYNEAVRIDPKYVTAYENLAVLHQGIIDRHLELVKEYKRKAADCGEQIADKR
jgi:tetratricopeptide (TPR) repeat protein